MKNMGIIIEHTSLPSKENDFRLQVYKSALGEDGKLAFSMNQPLAEELLKLKPFRRTMQMQNCFNKIVGSLPDNPVIKDIDVMFNPSYEIDVLKILINAHRQKPFKLIWPGKRRDDKLIYSEPGLPDYHEYNIKNYDIMFIK